MGIPHDHGQGFLSTELLDGVQVDLRMNQTCGMNQKYRKLLGKGKSQGKIICSEVPTF